MKTHAMLVIAMMAVAAFAGVALVDFDEADAAEGDDISVSFKIGDNTFSKNLKETATATVALPSIADLGMIVPVGDEFKGWQIGGEGTIYAVGTELPVADATGKTFHAKLVPITYTVKFLDGETEIPVSANDGITASDTITKPAVNPSKEGYIFLGWAVQGTETVVEFTTDTKPTTNVTYVAVYSVDYKVQFLASDGMVSKTLMYSDLMVEGGFDANILPDTPSKANYTFLGWFDGDVEFKTKAASGDKLALDFVISKDMKFSAEFDPVTFEVSFISEGKAFGTVQTVKYGEPATDPKNAPTKEGYDFAGWVIRTVTPGVDGAADVITDVAYDFTKPVESDLVLTAVFKEAEPEPEPEPVYNVVFKYTIMDENGELVEKSLAMPIAVFKDMGNFALVAPVEEGQKFTGWYVGMVKVDDPFKYVAEKTDITGDIIFTASYDKADPIEAPFLSTTGGQIAAILAAFIVILGFAYIWKNDMFGLRSRILSIGKGKTSAVQGPEEPKQ